MMLPILTKSVDTVIQGGSDMGHRLSEDEVQQALDFCGKLFGPTGPDEHRVTARFLAEKFKDGVTDNPSSETANLKFLDIKAPVIDPQIIETIVRRHPMSIQKPASDIGDTTADSQPNAGNSTADAGCEEFDMKAVLERVNARRAIHFEGVHNFEEEPLGRSGTDGGWVTRLERGKLGLVHPVE